MEPPEAIAPDFLANNEPRRPSNRVDWDNQKERIRLLYVSENRPLRDVIAIMKERYGFLATERQYKSKVSEWKMDKNIRKTEMKFMVRKQESRKSEKGKKSAFRIRGRPVEQRKIDRFRKERDGEMQAPAPPLSTVSGDTPSDISYFTPGDAHSRLSPITPPAAVLTPDNPDAMDHSSLGMLDSFPVETNPEDSLPLDTTNLRDSPIWDLFLNLDAGGSEWGATKVGRVVEELLSWPQSPTGRNFQTGVETAGATFQNPTPEPQEPDFGAASSIPGSWGLPRVQFDKISDIIPVELCHKVDAKLEREAEGALSNPWDPDQVQMMRLATMIADADKFKFYDMRDPGECLIEDFGDVAYLLSAILQLGDLSIFESQEPSKGLVHSAYLVGQTYFIGGRLHSAGACLRQVMKHKHMLSRKDDQFEALRLLGEISRVLSFQETAEDILIACATESQKVLELYHKRTLHSLRSLGTAYIVSRKLDRAMHVLEVALEGYITAFGKWHPMTAEVVIILAHLYADEGTFERIARHMERIME
ncbi:uncharacterized protein PAC_16640 [Phialocephala subalpina]|uniref:Clr5 domain-containing protein n=1 Tax=Phialocephala subalpina TaxID=576137 RepID=A0A1L7XNX5_9HELO|nr:uncharacterized protein PAC_16640 [Phialocephala subalpina]